MSAPEPRVVTVTTTVHLMAAESTPPPHSTSKPPPPPPPKTSSHPPPPPSTSHPPSLTSHPPSSSHPPSTTHSPSATTSPDFFTQPGRVTITTPVFSTTTAAGNPTDSATPVGATTKSSFIHNRGAVTAVFVVVGLLVLTALGFCGWFMRKRIQRRKTRREFMVYKDPFNDPPPTIPEMHHSYSSRSLPNPHDVGRHLTAPSISSSDHSGAHGLSGTSTLYSPPNPHTMDLNRTAADVVGMPYGGHHSSNRPAVSFPEPVTFPQPSPYKHGTFTDPKIDEEELKPPRRARSSSTQSSPSVYPATLPDVHEDGGKDLNKTGSMKNLSNRPLIFKDRPPGLMIQTGKNADAVYPNSLLVYSPVDRSRLVSALNRKYADRPPDSPPPRSLDSTQESTGPARPARNPLRNATYIKRNTSV